VTGRYDDAATPEIRQALEMADAFVTRLEDQPMLSQQEVADLATSRYLLQVYHISGLTARVDELEHEVRVLRAACRTALGDAFPSP
jgi:hypothetical protein